MITNPEQEQAVNSNKRNILVLAGAGSGKTKTLIDRIRYYINNKKVNPKNILTITFTKDAIHEIQGRLIEYTDNTNQYHNDVLLGNKDKVNKAYIEKSSILKSLTVRTFHSLCLSILKESGAAFFDNQFKILGDNVYDKNSGIDNECVSPKETVSTLLRKSIISACEHEEGFLVRLKQYLMENGSDKKKLPTHQPDIYNKPFITKNGLSVRSKSEQKIADWFYDLGYEMEYEPNEIARTFRFKPDFKLNTKEIYIEHKSELSAPLHGKLAALKSQNKLVFVTLDAWMADSRKIEEELLKILKSAHGGNYTSNFSKIFDNQFSLLQTDLSKFIKHIKQLYDLSKSQGMRITDIKNLQSPLFSHARIKDFYFLYPIVWKYYDELKKKHSLVDFSDLISLTTELLKSDAAIQKFYKDKFKYILVDEFQDVNAAQVELLKLLYDDNTNLFCVGDDWQSIYGFRGSDVNYIIHFDKHFPNSDTIKLKYNFRSTENIVKVGEQIIRYNKNRIDKEVLSLKKSDQKVILYKSNIEQDMTQFIEQQLEIHFNNGIKSDEVLILGRRRAHYNSIEPALKKMARFETIHGSKGLEAKVVFITGLTNEQGGFPEAWLADSIYQVCKQTDKDMLIEEERRLFYVAITRAKDFLYLLTKNGQESQFISELPEAFIDEEIAIF